MRQPGVVIEQGDDLGDVVNFFVGAAGGAQREDIRFRRAFRISRELHSAITQRARFRVKLCAAIILLHLRGKNSIVRGGTEILPVGFQSIKTIVGPGGDGSERLALRARQRRRAEHDRFVEFERSFEDRRVQTLHAQDIEDSAGAADGFVEGLL